MNQPTTALKYLTFNIQSYLSIKHIFTHTVVVQNLCNTSIPSNRAGQPWFRSFNRPHSEPWFGSSNRPQAEPLWNHWNEIWNESTNNSNENIWNSNIRTLIHLSNISSQTHSNGTQFKQHLNSLKISPRKRPKIYTKQTPLFPDHEFTITFPHQVWEWIAKALFLNLYLGFLGITWLGPIPNCPIPSVNGGPSS